MTPNVPLSDLVTIAESAINDYGNATGVVQDDQTKIASLQQKLSSDQDIANGKGVTAYTAVQTAISAFQQVLATLPQPPAVPIDAGTTVIAVTDGSITT